MSDMVPVSEMAPQAFRMEVGCDHGVDVVHLFGELDLVSADAVQCTLVERAGPVVVADLSQLEFIDSTGLSALLVARHAILTRKHNLEIRGAKGATRRVFEAAGLADVLDD
jgi:anti-sigma B factor antagonist